MCLKKHFLPSACKSLENLTLTLDVEENGIEDEARTNASKIVATIIETDLLEPSEYWSHFPLTNTLKSFVLQHSGNKSVCLDKQMKKIIQKIIKTSASNLRCFWTSIVGLDIDTSILNRQNMVAWNYGKIHLPPAIESVLSFVKRRKPSKFFGQLSKLKQIECPFELEVSSY